MCVILTVFTLKYLINPTSVDSKSRVNSLELVSCTNMASITSSSLVAATYQEPYNPHTVNLHIGGSGLGLHLSEGPCKSRLTPEATLEQSTEAGHPSTSRGIEQRQTELFQRDRIIDKLPRGVLYFTLRICITLLYFISPVYRPVTSKVRTVGRELVDVQRGER